MNINLPSPVSKAIEKLNDAGYQAYVVGGCVRDALMGRLPNDWDITTSAKPEQILAVFSQDRTLETGRKHGTITVLTDEMPLEITTYRVDGSYSDGRHPDAVSFTSLLADDLRRRDFTINAMAYHPVSGLVDLFGGQEDINRRLIRCVGDPYKRFSEDALRILRGLRFSATLQFNVEEKTSTALKQLSATLSKISVERITAEIEKLLLGVDAERVVQSYTKTIGAVIPEITSCTEFCLLSSVRAAIHVRLAALFYQADLPPVEAEMAMRRLRMDNKTIRDVTLLLTPITKSLYTEDAYILRLLHLVGPKWIFDYLAIREFDVLTVNRVQEILDEGRCYSLAMLAVNGTDLINSGIVASVDIGKTLNELLFAVMDGICPNDKESLFEYLKTIQKPVH